MQSNPSNISGLFVFTRLVYFFLGLISAQHISNAAERPNFIVIVADNLGYGDVEPFGSNLHRTPHLNRMAKEGRIFNHFTVTAGVCTPSRASLMTGCYAQRVQMHHNPRDGWVLRPVSPFGLNPDETTIAEMLKEQRYATALIGKWHLGDQMEFLPRSQGFDYFYGIPYSDDMTEDTGKRIAARSIQRGQKDGFQGDRWPPLPLMENDQVIEAPVNRDGLTKRYTEVALKWIEQHQDQPFFLYLPHAMPGSTSQPFSSPEFRGKSRNGPWGDAIEELDWSQGKILDKLVDLDIDQKTLVIWTSDNGAPIKSSDDPSRGSNQPLHGRGYTTAEGAFRVPTIMWWPGKIPAGTECEEHCTTMDLLPTFETFSGGSHRARLPKIDGYDISELVLGKPGARSPYPYFLYFDGEQLQAVRSGPWKLFVPLDHFRNHPHFKRGQKNPAMLFNLVHDIGSTTDVASKHPDVVNELMSYAEAGRKELGDVNSPGTGQRMIGKVKHPTPRVMR